MTLEHALFVAWLSASAMDAGTTFLASSAGAREMNPIYRTPAVVAAAKASIGTAEVVIVHRWEKDHPKFVRWLAVGVTVGYSAVAVHNLSVYRDQRRPR